MYRILIFISFLFFLLQILPATEYHVYKTEENLVKFISDAPIEDFEGITHKIDGYLYWEGDSMTKKSEVYFEVDLNSLDTGIGLRNRHMRENYLETDKYPLTYFRGVLVSVDTLDQNRNTVIVDGTMFIHGVEHQKQVEGILVREGRRLRIRTEFDVKLSDYDIKIPSIMFYKIDETMKLELDFLVELVEN